MIVSAKHLALAAACGLSLYAHAGLTINAGRNAPAASSTLLTPSASHAGFVGRSVANSASLVAVVKADEVARARYARHFEMDDAAVMAYLGGLRSGKLPKAGDYTLYGVDADGNDTSHVESLPAGEPMLVDAQGTPVIRVSGGEPVALSKPSLLQDAVDVPAPAPQATSETGGSRNRNALWAAPIGLFVGGIFLAKDGSGGGSNGFNPDPVPEPATLAALGLGVAALRRSRKRKA